jgi:hypothetical protein
LDKAKIAADPAAIFLVSSVRPKDGKNAAVKDRFTAAL